jgi:hypothetical protein
MRENQTLIDAKAQELLGRGQTAIQTADGVVRAKLVRFRSGAVLERWESSRESEGYGTVRVERAQLRTPSRSSRVTWSRPCSTWALRAVLSEANRS